jgi:predicted DNA-binding protein
MTTIQIPDEIMHSYEDRARATGFDTETLIREALIEKLEDLHDIQVAEERLADPQPTLSFDEVKRDLGLDD